MDYMSASYVLAALLHVLVTGGIQKDIWVLLFFNKLSDGFKILEMNIKNNDWKN
jgi:hypothetical protein